VESIDGGNHVTFPAVPDLAKDAEFLELTSEPIEFKIFTRDHEGQGTALKAWVEKADDPSIEGDWMIAGVASSTIRDHHGDTMLPSALMDMEKAANNNLTIFLNHSYKVPEDVAGSVRKASLTTRTNDDKGNPIYDLDFKLAVNKANSRAVEAFKALQGGTKLGLSIGANIPPGGAVRNRKDNTLTIMHVDLLETSIVSIPANPRSWIDAAVKAFKSAGSPTSNPALTLEAEPDVTEGEEVVDVVAAADTGSTAPLQGQGKCPTCGKAKSQGGDCKNPFHNTKDAAETIVSDDTVGDAGDPLSTSSTTPSQEAPQSEPGNDGSASETVIADATDVLTRTADVAVTADLAGSLLEVHNALAAVTDRLIDESRARIELERQVDLLTRERDQAKATSADVVTEVASLIEQLGKLPLGQKASFKRIQEDFSDLESVYPEEFIRQLRSIGK
jgi:HK97 family phage prohead protease